MKNHLEGKVVVITGAGSGFGRLVAEQACGLGAKVVDADVNIIYVMNQPWGVSISDITVRATGEEYVL